VKGRVFEMRRGMFVLLGLGAALGLIAGSALATPVINATAQTAMGPLVDRPLAVNWKFDPGTESSCKRRARSRSLFSGSPSGREEPWAGTVTRGRPSSRSSRGP
jgi:hypothetical protein